MFLEVFDVLTPPKTKIFPNNDPPFVDQQHWKDIYTRSKIKYRNPSKQNKIEYRKQKNICVSLSEKCMKNYLKTSQRKVQQPIRPFGSSRSRFL